MRLSWRGTIQGRYQTVDPDFWLARWQNNQIGFHEGRPNALLVAHFAALGTPAGGRIFVPLCGKSHDMHWLRTQGFTVVGAELSRLAVEQFFAELGLTPMIAPAGRLERFEAEGVTLFVGDIFDLDHDALCPVDAVYDRAALVALPVQLRERYAAHLIVLTSPAPQLLVTFEYDQARQPGPPFCVPEAEVRALYGATYRLDRADVREVPGGLKGVCPARESVWLINQR
jgi:thiopurine S-methyltransferase